MSITVEPVSTKKRLKQFVDFPYALYAKDPYWVPQLRMDEKKRFDREKHPFFQHADAEFFIALDGGRPVGRIAAIDDRLWKESYGEKAAYWGWFECVNDPAAARALFDAAAGWAKARGCIRIIGPMSPSANDYVGLLVKGFDDPPCILMVYNPAYYDGLVQGCGNKKWKDLLAWRIDDQTVPARLTKIMPMVERRGKFTIRPVNMKKFDDELKLFGEVYNEFEKVNAIYTPMTKEEIDYTGKDLKMAVDPGLVLFAEVDGKTVGLSFAIPDMNTVFKAANGRLFPFGIFKMLLAMRKVKRIRVISMGVLEGFRNRGIDLSFYYHTWEYGVKKGYTNAELSWVEEDNVAMNNVAQKLNAKAYKTYRIYERSL